MPVFVHGGPNIPENLMHAQEEGRVIFLCGAGISAAAGLPLFGKLVDLLYKNLNIEPNSIQKRYIKNGNFDLAIEHLENEPFIKRDDVRKNLLNILKPNLKKKYSLTLHKSLLTLSTDRNGITRIVTTNYDHLFREALHVINSSNNTNIHINEFSAPLLPTPKQSKWDGIVYLHGILPNNIHDDNSFDNLVLSSSDFGHAYLTERWASRFISELFKNYIVCFVGYSVNDPVMRYMVDAIAADKKSGDIQQTEFYSFCGCMKNNRQNIIDEWTSKNIIPIVYDSRGSGKAVRHSRLYKTFELWGEIYRDGLTGRKNIIAKYAMNIPSSNTKYYDEAVENVLWALKNKHAAKFFADMNPTPPLEWLRPLTSERYTTKDLELFGYLLSVNDKGKKVTFSLLDRPSSITTSRISLFDQGDQDVWDELMNHMARWLLRHINNPKLVLWLSKSGKCLNQKFMQMLQDTILSAHDNNIDIDKEMLKIWQLFLANRVGILPLTTPDNIYSIFEQILKYGVTYSIKVQLEYALTPYIIIKESYQSNKHFDFDIELNSDNIWSAIQYFRSRQEFNKWQSAQPELLNIYLIKLLDVCELMKTLGSIDEYVDLSYIYQPSIEEHKQNNKLQRWTILIELLRDAWVAISKLNQQKATIIAKYFWNTPYPIFKRLALYASKFTEIIELETTIQWLLSDNTYWLWSINTQREVMRLFTAIGSYIPPELGTKLEKAIANGPPQIILEGVTTPKERQFFTDRMIWLRLAKLKKGGYTLNELSNATFNHISVNHKEFHIEDDESDEFPFFTNGNDGSIISVYTPKSCKDLAKYLEMYPEMDYFENNDDWELRCKHDFDTALSALDLLNINGIFPIYRWKSFLYAISSIDDLDKYDDFNDLLFKIINILLVIDIETFNILSDAIGTWLNKLSKFKIQYVNLFIELCDKLITNYKNNQNSFLHDYIAHSINSPTGKATEAIINIWYQDGIQEGQGINYKYKIIFSKLCDITNNNYVDARIILYRDIILLYRIDYEWTKEYLLPSFNWKIQPDEAPIAWQGFLFSPRLYLQFILEMKSELLQTINNYEKLGIYGKNYATVMTYIALDQQDNFTAKELHNVFYNLPVDGLCEVILTIERELASTDKQALTNWNNRIEPFFNKIWPKDKKIDNIESISRSLAYFFVESGDIFPLLIGNIITNWLKPFSHSIGIARKLSQSELCKKFPRESLHFLAKIIDHNIFGMVDILKECLKKISEADSTTVYESDFIKLKTIAGE